MKTRIFFTAVIGLFVLLFLYLNQRVRIFIEAYELTDAYRRHIELVDKRDYLRYNLFAHTSLAKVNQWAESNRFAPIEKDNILALHLERKQPVKPKRSLAALFNRFFGPTTSTVLAGER